MLPSAKPCRMHMHTCRTQTTLLANECDVERDSKHCDCSSSGGDPVAFKYVYIPCDSSRPMEELTMHTTKAEIVGCLMGEFFLRAVCTMEGTAR